MEHDPRCLEVARHCTAAALRRATRTVSRIYEEVMAPSGLEGTQFSVLNALALMGGVPMRVLADRLGIDRTTLTRNLRPLERKGLIASVAADDQRVRLVELTARGRRVLDKALPLWQRAQQRVVKDLGRSRWQQLQALLGAVQALE
jgi:DNA-binding MarR family transcriptional regulator